MPISLVLFGIGYWLVAHFEGTGVLHIMAGFTVNGDILRYNDRNFFVINLVSSSPLKVY